MSDMLQRLESVRTAYRLRTERKRKPPGFGQWLRSPEGRWYLADRGPWQHGLDFRGPDLHASSWRVWCLGMPFNTGSGRSADWNHLGYVQYELVCRLLHQRFGWSGQRVRDAGRALQRAFDGGGDCWQPPADHVPADTLATLTVPDYTCQRHYSDVDDDVVVRRNEWYRWIRDVAHPAWGDFMLAHFRTRLDVDPLYFSPSDVVGEIRRLRGATDVTDLRGCSGCQYLPRVALLSVAEQDAFLARANKAWRVTLKNGLEGVHVPFGLEYPAEFDYCVVLGLNYEIRVRSHEFTALDGASIIGAL